MHTPEDPEHPDPAVYFAWRESDDHSVINLRMKQLIVEANGLASGWDWRTHPGEKELATLIEKFSGWYVSKFHRY